MLLDLVSVALWHLPAPLCNAGSIFHHGALSSLGAGNGSFSESKMINVTSSWCFWLDIGSSQFNQVMRRQLGKGVSTNLDHIPEQKAMNGLVLSD